MKNYRELDVTKLQKIFGSIKWHPEPVDGLKCTKDGLSKEKCHVKVGRAGNQTNSQETKALISDGQR